MFKTLLFTTLAIGLTSLPAAAGEHGPRGSGVQIAFGMSFGGPAGGYYAPGPPAYYVNTGPAYQERYGYYGGAPRYAKSCKRYEKAWRKQEKYYRQSQRNWERQQRHEYKSYYKHGRDW